MISHRQNQSIGRKRWLAVFLHETAERRLHLRVEAAVPEAQKGVGDKIPF